MPRISRRRGSWLGPAGRLRAGRRWRLHRTVVSTAASSGTASTSTVTPADAESGACCSSGSPGMPTAPGSGRSRRGSSPRTGAASRSISGAAFAWSALRRLGRQDGVWRDVVLLERQARRSASPACRHRPDGDRVADQQQQGGAPTTRPTTRRSRSAPRSRRIPTIASTIEMRINTAPGRRRCAMPTQSGSSAKSSLS